jgi:hypothetical protein
MDAVLRAILWIAVGLLLLAANFWFGRSLYALYRSGDFVIVPFRVMGEKLGPDSGNVLAILLKDRLDEIQGPLIRLTEPLSEIDPAIETLYKSPQIVLKTQVFKPFNFEVDVAGISLVAFSRGCRCDWCRILSSRSR